MLFATSFWAKNALCHEFKKQASFKIVFFHIELLVRSYCLGFSYCFS